MIRKVKSLHTFILIILLVALTVNFSVFVSPNSPVYAAGRIITDQQALNAIRQVWICSGECSLRLIGVRDLPEQNMAMVDIEVSNMPITLPKNDPITAYAFGPGGGTQIWSGTGVAVFAHYSDGRWVLRQIISQQGTWDNLNIVVQQ